MSGDKRAQWWQPLEDEGQEEPVMATGEPAPVEPAAEMAALQEELAKKSAEAAEYLDNWRRTTADLSNARKRMLREQEETRAAAAERVLEKLLPVLDDMDRAFAALPTSEAESEWVAGFRAIQRKLHGLLESEGVTPIKTEGQAFDPELHHAVTHEKIDGYDEGQIIGEAARGYMLRDRVLRPSLVRVAKDKDA